ncbi:MAG: O-antigen ligase family protein [Bacteroidota bacterium]
MKKQAVKTKSPQHNSTPPMRVIYLMLLFAHALITVITPSFGAYDSNAPKFLAISLLNLFSFLFLFSNKEFRNDPKLFSSFFSNRIGLVYTLFIGMVLLSFTKAINIPESILSFSKYFTVFCSAYIISILLRSDKRYFRILIVVIAIVLITDSLTVFYNIFLYITNEIGGILEIQSVYSNKNILAAAIFIKIPFALWLVSFEKGWMKKLGYFSFFCAGLAVFFMSTRAFYLGLIFLTLVYSAYLVILYRRNPTKQILETLASFFGLLLLAFTIYSLTQYYLFPKSQDIYNKSYAERLSTISKGESTRVDCWKRSAKLFKQDPLLGVGTGNWKIRVLQYETPAKSDYVFMVKNHNDFLEVATETGILGGLLFFSLFIFLMLNFGKAFFKTGATENSFSYLFLPAFGIFCYSFDAFFNFPADRPEMQSLFALFIGSGIAFSPASLQKGKTPNRLLIRSLSFIIILLVVSGAYVLQIDTRCLKLQRFYQADGVFGHFTHASDLFIKGYPKLLNVSSNGDPISVIKSQYLMNEEKYQDAINLLLPDRSSPYDGRREYLLAKAFSKLGKNDTALQYAYKANALKPLLYEPLGFICFMLNTHEKKEEAIKKTEAFLAIEKSSSKAWLDLTSFYLEASNYQKAITCIDSAAIYHPKDSAVTQQKHNLSLYKGIVPYQQAFATAMKFYNQQKFPEALKFLNQIVDKNQDIPIVYARRGVCYYNTKEYQKCINDITRTISGGNDDPDLLNIRGACYLNLGKEELACMDFQNAAARGNKAAEINSQRLCKGK